MHETPTKFPIYIKDYKKLKASWDEGTRLIWEATIETIFDVREPDEREI